MEYLVSVPKGEGGKISLGGAIAYIFSDFSDSEIHLQAFMRYTSCFISKLVSLYYNQYLYTGFILKLPQVVLRSKFFSTISVSIKQQTLFKIPAVKTEKMKGMLCIMLNICIPWSCSSLF